MKRINYEPADIEIYVRGHGIVLKEQALLALSPHGRVQAIGNAAAEGNFSEGTFLISPLHQGRVSDSQAAEYMFREFITRAHQLTGKADFLKKPVVGVCVKGRLNDIELQAYREILGMAGAREVAVLTQTLSEFLALVSEEKQKKYEMIISVSKDNPEVYVRERAQEIVAFASRNGVSKEQLIEMINEVQ